jgi:hypothetical protein
MTTKSLKTKLPLRKHKKSTEALERPLRLFLTTKMYTKLASIVINDEILSKVGGIRNYFGKNMKNEVKIQKLL